MKSCTKHRERLGEFLVGALDAAAAGEIERHIVECGECSAELAELQRLEGLLWSAEPARAERRRAPWVLAAAALLFLAGGVAALALGTLTGGDPRFIRGEIAGLEAGTIPLGQELRAMRDSTIILPGVAWIHAGEGAQLAIRGNRSVRLEAGEAIFRIDPEAGGFRAETPLGQVDVPGTSFRLKVTEESKMSGSVIKGGAAAVVIVSVVSGAVLWTGAEGGAPARVEAGKVGIAREGSFEISAPAAEAEKLEGEATALRAEREALLSGKKELAEKLADLSAEVEALRSEESKEAAPKLKFTFGSHAELEVLQSADWRAMGEAAASMTKLLEELVALEKPFEEAPKDLLLKFGMQNMKLVPIALNAAGKLPTHSRWNGEFTHPIIHWNILAEALSQAGIPLSKAQLRRLASLGTEYDRAWENLQSSYGPDALLLEKVLDELEIKKQFWDRLETLLSRRQREALGKPELRHRSMLDLYSPMLLLGASSQTLQAASKEEIRAEVEKALEGAWKVDMKEPSNAALLDAFLGSIDIARAPPWLAQSFSYDELMAMGPAQLKLMRGLLASEKTGEETRKRIGEMRFIIVPRLTEAR